MPETNNSARNLTETKNLCYIFEMSKKFIKIFIFFLIFLPLGFQVFALNPKDETKNSLQTQKKAEVKDTFKIDFRFNTKVQDKKNHLKWKTSSKKVSDSYDALSGASVSHSTGELLTLFRDGNSKNYLAPKGLRQLLLFAVSNPKYLESDNFMAEKDGDGKIKISFTHRETGYFIQTDEKGWLNLENGFFIKKPQEEKQNTDFTDKTNNTDNIERTEDFEQKEKFSSKNLDTENFEKIEISADEEFYPDKPNIKQNDNPNSVKKFEGKLSVKLSGGILKIIGKMNLVEYKEETSEENSKEISEATSEKI